MTPAPEERRHPFWSYGDIALFLGAVLPSVALSALLLRWSRAIFPALFKNEAATALALQAFMYGFLLGSLFLLVSLKYRQPFWSSLDWKMPFSGAAKVLLAGPLLAITISVLGVALKAPALDNPIQRMITGRTSLAVVTLFGVLLAPFFEELLFRGFVFPLVARSLGVWPGIVFTAIPFALLHGAQNEWAWQQITLIALAGIAFGIARAKTGSTAGAFLVHSSYNATQFLGLILTRF